MTRRLTITHNGGRPKRDADPETFRDQVLDDARACGLEVDGRMLTDGEGAWPAYDVVDECKTLLQDHYPPRASPMPTRHFFDFETEEVDR